MSAPLVVSDNCNDLQVAGKPETFCCSSCIAENEGGYYDHRKSVLVGGRWIDAGFCCHRHYEAFEARIIARYREDAHPEETTP